MTPTIDNTIRSPNYSSRNGRKIFMLVMHATAGHEASDLDILTNDRVPLAKRVSVHYYVTKPGHIYQLVDDSFAAWHAGKAYWNSYGPVQIQEGSLGIEMENLNNGIDPYPVEQTNAVLDLAKFLVYKYTIIQTNIVSHQQIAGVTEGKTDPRGFNMDKFKQDILYGKWGDAYPLPIEQRGYGIPTTWANDQGNLGQAVSNPMYIPEKGANPGQFVIQFFRAGYILGYNKPHAPFSIIRLPELLEL